jgi:protein-disulfide isomerase
MLARCVAPERYLAVIDTLFETQDSWAFTRDWRGALERIARLAGLSKKQFDECLANKAVEDQVVQSRLTAATQLEVNSTPTFFINGKKFQGAPTAQAFEQALSDLAARS